MKTNQILGESPLPIYYEIETAIKVHEAQRRLELSKFPKVSAKLNNFLKNKNMAVFSPQSTKQHPTAGKLVPTGEQNGGVNWHEKGNESVMSTIYSIKKDPH